MLYQLSCQERSWNVRYLRLKRGRVECGELRVELGEDRCCRCGGARGEEREERGGELVVRASGGVERCEVEDLGEAGRGEEGG